jgi:hypothetical protein
MPRAGFLKIVPAVLAWLNKERSAVRVWRRRLAGRESVAMMTSELPRVFRTGNPAVIYAAACNSSSSSMTSCGVL